MAKGRLWTKEDEEWLKERWGLVRIEYLVLKLKRTEGAIRQRACRLNLGLMQGAGGTTLTPPEVAKMINRSNRAVYSYIKKGYLKAKKRKIKGQYRYQIKLEDLMEFIEKHQDKWDSYEVDLYTFGTEPEWLKEKRKKDTKAKRNMYKKWTYEEEVKLINLINLGFPVKEIAETFGRTTYGIYQKTGRLREQGRLQPTKIMIYWTNEELKILFELEEQGLTDEQIAYELGREKMHVSDKKDAKETRAIRQIKTKICRVI